MQWTCVFWCVAWWVHSTSNDTGLPIFNEGFPHDTYNHTATQMSQIILQKKKNIPDPWQWDYKHDWIVNSSDKHPKSYCPISFHFVNVNIYCFLTIFIWSFAFCICVAVVVKAFNLVRSNRLSTLSVDINSAYGICVRVCSCVWCRQLNVDGWAYDSGSMCG